MTRCWAGPEDTSNVRSFTFNLLSEVSITTEWSLNYNWVKSQLQLWVKSQLQLWVKSQLQLWVKSQLQLWVKSQLQLSEVSITTEWSLNYNWVKSQLQLSEVSITTEWSLNYNWVKSQLQLSEVSITTGLWTMQLLKCSAYLLWLCH